MKMVVADLDGTLLRSDGSLSKRTIDAVRGLDRYGVHFVIATARPQRSVAGSCLPCVGGRYGIYYNGAEIRRGDELIYKKYMDPHETGNFVTWLMDRYEGINVSLEISNRLYCNFEIMLFNGWTGPYTKVDLRKFEYAPVAKILIDLCSIEDISEIAGKIPPGCSMTVTDGGTLGQVMHRDVSKFNAVKMIAGLLKTDLEDVAAFGDDYNDLGMICGCGIGVAMGNAPADVRAKADIVALANDEDGAAIELEKLICLKTGRLYNIQGYI